MKVALPEQLPKPDGAIVFWTLYDHPRDAPHAFVLRATFVVSGKSEPILSTTAWYADDPDKLRAIIPPGAHRFSRSPDDDPVIIETWME